MRSLENLRGVCKNLKKCAADFKGVLSYLKAKEWSLRVLSDEFGQCEAIRVAIDVSPS